MSSRDSILQSLRRSLADGTSAAPLPVSPTVWPTEHLDHETLVERFRTALESVQGEFLRCDSLEEATEKIKTLFRENGVKTVGLFDRPSARSIAASFGSEFDARFDEEVSPEEMARWDAGILVPDFLLADTGSCFLSAATAYERLLCYIVPFCVFVVSKDRIREHLPHLWSEIRDRFAPGGPETQTNGEFLLMTGPSRTADIEKVLILGVHGPQRVVVVMLEHE